MNTEKEIHKQLCTAVKLIRLIIQQREEAKKQIAERLKIIEMLLKQKL